MASFKTLCNEVELLVQFPEVGLAISDSATPMPGYLYGEINAITYMDYGNNCKPLVNFLISRLQESIPFTSVKVLKLLLYLVKNGHTEIVEEVKNHEIPIKAAMSFHGPPHDLHGKTFYENVRKLSKELLEYVYSENKEELSDNITAPIVPELSGYGSNANTQGLPGFGFSVQSPKSVSEKISEGVSNLVEKLLPMNERETNKEQISHLKENLPHYKPLIINKTALENENISSSVVHTPQKSTHINRTKLKRVYRPGKPGGGWDESDDEKDDKANVVQDESCKGSSASFDCIEISKLEIKEDVNDWVEEHKVVDSFAINEPLHDIDSAAVKILCKGCSSLNCDKILMFLLDKLEEKEELIQLRALILIEYLIHYDILSIDSLLNIVVPPLKKMLDEKSDQLLESVMWKAKKVTLIIRNLNKLLKKCNCT